MTPDNNPIIPLGFCQCGCGERTTLANKTQRDHGRIAGQPFRYLPHHHKPTGKERMTHGHYSGGHSTSTYRTWAAMLSRCRNPNHSQFKHYGARNIKVCERWFLFEKFLLDMGERPAGKTIDRINSDGNYEPSNCQWSTARQQANNKRNNRLIEWNGKIYTFSELAAASGIKVGSLRVRLDYGWPLDKALSAPIRKSSRWHKE